MEKYYVVAKKWNSEQKKVANYVAGEFSEFHLAAMFSQAYKENYNAPARIVRQSDMMKGFVLN